MYELASRTFAAPADRLVLLDDIAANVDAARASGWKALQFTDAISCEQALRANGWWPSDVTADRLSAVAPGPPSPAARRRAPASTIACFHSSVSV